MLNAWHIQSVFTHIFQKIFLFLTSLFITCLNTSSDGELIVLGKGELKKLIFEICHIELKSTEDFKENKCYKFRPSLWVLVFLELIKWLTIYRLQAVFATHRINLFVKLSGFHKHSAYIRYFNAVSRLIGMQRMGQHNRWHENWEKQKKENKIISF